MAQPNKRAPRQIKIALPKGHAHTKAGAVFAVGEHCTDRSHIKGLPIAAIAARYRTIAAAPLGTDYQVVTAELVA